MRWLLYLVEGLYLELVVLQVGQDLAFPAQLVLLHVELGVEVSSHPLHLRQPLYTLTGHVGACRQ